MARLALATLVLALLVGLTGCGQKGPLYLPDDEPAADQVGPRDAANAPDESET
ncbi:LPS translocon maturation chaperone LptM [Halomonas sp. RA08-2]|uniref:LPS translocon maturation chaperone LptM n=1 Tax=Halomonas sp. RA08-2 TaxID=3440842 RepID=UPI003EEED463